MVGLFGGIPYPYQNSIGAYQKKLFSCAEFRGHGKFKVRAQMFEYFEVQYLTPIYRK